VKVVHLVVPGGIDDPRQPSGGNTYDRRLSRGLADTGWFVQEHAVPGTWPDADAESHAALGTTLEGVPAGRVVVVDSLVASAAPDALVAQAGRLRLVVLVHMPLGHAVPDVRADGGCPHDGGRLDDGRARARSGESAVLHAAAAVVATSRWTRRWLLAAYELDPGRVLVAPPGVDPAELSRGSGTGRRLLCVGAVTPTKGQDVLVEALAGVAAHGWRCTCVGPLDREPAFTGQVRARVRSAGLDARIRFTGPRVGRELAAAYSAADLLVAAARAETYGMVVTEALARGLPVVATRVGGLPEALGRAPGGRRPGILVPPRDPRALAEALEEWMTDPALRRDLRTAARGRRSTLGSWSVTSDTVARVLDGVAA
jgi:glycosyltransferase involved in cell wall biosynthesis